MEALPARDVSGHDVLRWLLLLLCGSSSNQLLAEITPSQPQAYTDPAIISIKNLTRLFPIFNGNSNVR
jgi:hypothetical protein